MAITHSGLRIFFCFFFLLFFPSHRQCGHLLLSGCSASTLAVLMASGTVMLFRGLVPSQASAILNGADGGDPAGQTHFRPLPTVPATAVFKSSQCGFSCSTEQYLHRSTFPPGPLATMAFWAGPAGGGGAGGPGGGGPAGRGPAGGGE